MVTGPKTFNTPNDIFVFVKTWPNSSFVDYEIFNVKHYIELGCKSFKHNKMNRYCKTVSEI